MAAIIQESRECAVKIAYIYYLLKSVTWPRGTSPRKTRSADVCIIGDSTLSIHFEALNEKISNDHIQVNISYAPTSATIPDCHILFIDRTALAWLTPILEQAGSRPILTISNIPGFADKGGMIELVKVKQGKAAYIRPRINSAIAEISNITLGAELLLIADHASNEGLFIISEKRCA